MDVRAIRGATTVKKNTVNCILKGTEELLNRIISKNSLKVDNIISIIFTVTNDLNAAFPASAARELGITDIPLMCMREIDVPGSLEKCIRILMHINTSKKNDEITHIYLKEAKSLRPDLLGGNN